MTEYIDPADIELELKIEEEKYLEAGWKKAFIIIGECGHEIIHIAGTTNQDFCPVCMEMSATDKEEE